MNFLEFLIDVFSFNFVNICCCKDLIFGWVILSFIEFIMRGFIKIIMCFVVIEFFCDVSLCDGCYRWIIYKFLGFKVEII